MLPCGFLCQGAGKEKGCARHRSMTCEESVPSWDALRCAGVRFSPFTYYYSRRGPFWQRRETFFEKFVPTWDTKQALCGKGNTQRLPVKLS